MDIRSKRVDNCRKLLVGIMIILLGSGLYYYAYQSISFTVNASLREIARHGAQTVAAYMEAKFSQLETMEMSEIISNPATSRAQRIEYMKEIAKTYDYHRVSYTTLDGASYTSENEDLYIGDRTYFTEAAKGKRFVSDPLPSRVNGTWMIVYAIPVTNKQGQVVAVLSAAHKAETLSKFSANIKYGNEGYSVIFNKQGNVVAHKNLDLVYKRDNIIKNSKADSSYKELAFLQERMISGENGSGEYMYQGVKKVMGFAPIKGTDWYFAVTVPSAYVFSSLDGMLRFIIIVYVVFGISFVLCEIYVRRQGDNINAQTNKGDNNESLGGDLK